VIDQKQRDKTSQANSAEKERALHWHAIEGSGKRARACSRPKARGGQAASLFCLARGAICANSRAASTRICAPASAAWRRAWSSMASIWRSS